MITPLVRRFLTSSFVALSLILSTSNAFSPSLHRASCLPLPLAQWSNPVASSITTATGTSATATSTTGLNAAAATQQLAQHAGEAISLFNNMKTPASIIAGAIVPLGFLAPIQLQSEPNDTEMEKRVRKLYYVLSTMTLATELIAVMWATVATNGLTERTIAPATSVWHLLKRDFELEWAAVNTHFVVGMLGFLGMIGTRAYFMAQKGLLGKSVLGLALSGLSLMVSIVNRGVAAGGGGGCGPNFKTTMRYGANVLALGKCYISLLIRRAITLETFGPIELTSVSLFSISLVGALKAVWQNNDTEDKQDEAAD